MRLILPFFFVSMVTLTCDADTPLRKLKIKDPVLVDSISNLIVNVRRENDLHDSVVILRLEQHTEDYEMRIGFMEIRVLDTFLYGKKDHLIGYSEVEGCPVIIFSREATSTLFEHASQTRNFDFTYPKPADSNNSAPVKELTILIEPVTWKYKYSIGHVSLVERGLLMLIE